MNKIVAIPLRSGTQRFKKTKYKSSKEKVNVFLPMRAGSERVPRKNTKTFAGIDGGLCKIKLEQLLTCDLVETIFISTDDPEVIKISNSFNSKKIKIILRPDELASSSTSTDDLIRYVPDIMPDGHVLWTHVTSPFIGPSIYDQIIEKYLKNLIHHDSLMTVTKLQKFIWNDGEPVNYDRRVEKWPRTQTIDPLWEVNSGAFIATKAIYKDSMDRIGSTPYLFQLSLETAFDIDWLPDFETAEAMYHTRHSRNAHAIT
jgi:CMP-N-acetylneuraminic acid synthetase